MIRLSAALRNKVPQTGQPALDTTLGELSRDIADALDQTLALRIIKFSEKYTEPLYVGFDHEPEFLFAGRIRRDDKPEQVILTGGVCAFVWDANNKRLQVNSIDGMTPDANKYRYTFLAVG